MKFLPYDQFSIHTPQHRLEVIDKLDAQIEAPKAIRWGFSHNHAPYEGTISTSGFEIHRIIHYRNSFLPMIRGRFESTAAGTTIHITMRLNSFVTAFLIFWFFMWYSATIPIFVLTAFSEGFAVEGLLFLGAPIVLLFVFWAAFWSEANRSRRELTQSILGQPPQPPTSHHLVEPRTGNNMKPRNFLFSLLTIIIFTLATTVYQQISDGKLSCSQAYIQSPYCDLSVVHTLTGYPTDSTLAIGSEGKILVSGGEDKAIKVWDLQTGELKKILQSDSGMINTLAMTPDQKNVISGSGDRIVRIWDITSDQPPQILKGHSGNVTDVKISSDGKTLVSISEGTSQGKSPEIKVWDIKTGQIQATLTLPYFRFQDISPDGKKVFLILSNSQLVALDVATNQQTVIPNAFKSSRARMSLDGQTLASIKRVRKRGFHLKILDLNTGEIKVQKRFPKRFRMKNMALSRDSIIASTPKGLAVWNLETAELEATLNAEEMNALVVSPDGNFLAGITRKTSDNNYRAKIQVFRQP